MTKLKFVSCLFILFTIFGSHNTGAQTDSKNLYEWFDAATGSGNGILLNGTVDITHYRSQNADNTPFFNHDAFTQGSVVYDGQPFYGRRLKYDITRDQLIVEPDDGRSPIALTTEKVSQFEIYGKKFVNLSQLSSVLNGFYEESASNEAFTFYIKHHKDTRDVIANETLYSDFTSADSYIVFYKNAYHPISSKKSVIALFPEHKAEISKIFSNRGKQNTKRMEALFQYLKTAVQ